MADHIQAVKGLRILVVEDMLLVAEMICEGLEFHGCEVVGPAARLQRGLVLARTERLDGAVLDINLAGEPSFPIAQELSRRRIPFIFVTGYGAEANIPPELQSAPRLNKPFYITGLVRIMAEHFVPQA